MLIDGSACYQELGECKVVGAHCWKTSGTAWKAGLLITHGYPPAGRRLHYWFLLVHAQAIICMECDGAWMAPHVRYKTGKYVLELTKRLINQSSMTVSAEDEMELLYKLLTNGIGKGVNGQYFRNAKARKKIDTQNKGRLAIGGAFRVRSVINFAGAGVGEWGSDVPQDAMGS